MILASGLVPGLTSLGAVIAPSQQLEPWVTGLWHAPPGSGAPGLLEPLAEVPLKRAGAGARVTIGRMLLEVEPPAPSALMKGDAAAAVREP